MPSIKKAELEALYARIRSLESELGDKASQEKYWLDQSWEWEQKAIHFRNVLWASEHEVSDLKKYAELQKSYVKQWFDENAKTETARLQLRAELEKQRANSSELFRRYDGVLWELSKAFYAEQKIRDGQSVFILDLQDQVRLLQEINSTQAGIIKDLQKAPEGVEIPNTLKPKDALEFANKEVWDPTTFYATKLPPATGSGEQKSKQYKETALVFAGLAIFGLTIALVREVKIVHELREVLLQAYQFIKAGCPFNQLQ